MKGLDYVLAVFGQKKVGNLRNQTRGLKYSERVKARMAHSKRVSLECSKFKRGSG